MFETIGNFIAANLMLSIVFGAIFSIILVIKIKSLRYWLRDFFIHLPIPFTTNIPKLAKDSTEGSNGWRRSEEALCAIYHKRIPGILNEKQFDQSVTYLSKATDGDKTPAPIYAWILLGVLVIAEGLGFSYLLAGWIARDGSERTLTLMMFAIVLVICLVMLFLTHAAGHQYRRTSLLRACFQRFKQTGGDDNSVNLIKLSDEQTKDDENTPDYTRILNRVASYSGDEGKYGWVYAAIIAILVIAVTSTVMRYVHLQNELTTETTGQASAYSNPFDNLGLPNAITEPQETADAKAKSQQNELTEVEGLAAFSMLAFIFIITQIVGMGVGYKYGFVGRNSKQAYKLTKGCKHYHEYWSECKPLLDNGNSKLKSLQQKMEERSHKKLTLTKTFVDYVQEQSNGIKIFSENKSSNSSAEVNQNNANETKPIVNETSASDIEEAKQTLLKLKNNKEEKMAFYFSLSEETQKELEPWLEELKNNETKDRERREKLF